MTKETKDSRINIRVREDERQALIAKSKQLGFDNFSAWVLYALRTHGGTNGNQEKQENTPQEVN